MGLQTEQNAITSVFGVFTGGFQPTLRVLARDHTLRNSGDDDANLDDRHTPPSGARQGGRVRAGEDHDLDSCTR